MFRSFVRLTYLYSAYKRDEFGSGESVSNEMSGENKDKSGPVNKKVGCWLRKLTGGGRTMVGKYERLKEEVVKHEGYDIAGNNDEKSMLLAKRKPI